MLARQQILAGHETIHVIFKSMTDDCTDGQRCSNIALAFPTSMWVTGGSETQEQLRDTEVTEKTTCVLCAFASPRPLH